MPSPDGQEYRATDPAPLYSQFILVKCPDCGAGRYGLKRRPETWGHCLACRQRRYKQRCVCEQRNKVNCRRHCHKEATGFAQPFEVIIWAE